MKWWPRLVHCSLSPVRVCNMWCLGCLLLWPLACLCSCKSAEEQLQHNPAAPPWPWLGPGCLGGRLWAGAAARALLPRRVWKFPLAEQRSKRNYSGCCGKRTVAGVLPPFWLCKSGIMQKSYLSLVLFLLNQLSTCLYSSVTVTCHCFALTPHLRRSLSQGRAGKGLLPWEAAGWGLQASGIPQRLGETTFPTRHCKPHEAEKKTEIANS